MSSSRAIDLVQRLKILIDSTTPLIAIETVEEQRAIAMVRAAASELNLPVFEWSIADGLAKSGATAIPPIPGIRNADDRLAEVNAELARQNLPTVVIGKDQYAGENAPAPLYNTKEAAQMLAHLETLTVEGVFILKDLHRHMEHPVVVRLLREVAHEFSRDRRTLVLTAPSLPMPAELANQVEFLDLPLPDRLRLRKLIDECFDKHSQRRKLQRKLDSAGIEAMTANLSGLTELEAERAISQAIIGRYGLLPETVTDVLEAKRDILRRSDMLEFIPTAGDLKQIGGLDNLKAWLHKRHGAFDERARAAGLSFPRGVIIMGVQGCGKSMCARCIAGEWKLPLVKFEAAQIFDKYIGETEKRIQRMFRVAEQLAPCVLWIDELEKIFAGTAPDSASSDAGTASRLLGAFLSWMQDKKAPVFVAATSNNVTVLPPELIRKGRFDEIFFVDLPNLAERLAIFKLQLNARKMDAAKFDVQALAQAAEGYSGAEIEAAIQSAMYASFADKTPVSTQMLEQELAATIPLSASRAEDIARLREWARQRAVPASLPAAMTAKT